jgi:deoxycytidine triphosphate deaminase
MTPNELERVNHEEATSPIDLATWSKPPTDEELTQSFWVDPEPEFSGMLSADRIRAYNYEVGRMIRPFQDENLKPAAYELTLGPRWSDGSLRELSDDDPYLKIPPNSIVFASMREMLLMPHWLAGRFDLAIEFIYQGLLLGTGPQVDPGFKGVLSCPLHNISNQTITLTYGKPFAKIDFTKTSFGKLQLEAISDEDALYNGVTDRSLRGYKDQPLVLWKKNKNFRPPITFASSDVTEVSSSVHDLEDRIEAVEGFTKTSADEVDKRVTSTENKVDERVTSTEKQLRVGGLVGVVGFIAVLVSLVALVMVYVDGRIDAASSGPTLSHLRSETRRLSSELEKARAAERQIMKGKGGERSQ